MSWLGLGHRPSDLSSRLDAAEAGYLAAQADVGRAADEVAASAVTARERTEAAAERIRESTRREQDQSLRTSYVRDLVEDVLTRPGLRGEAARKSEQ